MSLSPVAFIVLSVLTALSPLAATAHEFWIEPERYQVDPGERLQGNFKNGELFKGGTLAYFDRSAARFDLLIGDELQTITPRSGDRPALDIPAPDRAGLVRVVHETTDAFVTYREWEKFLKFARHKDFTRAAEDHAAAGWSKTLFRERYTRHAKALFAVGDGAGRDAPSGMITEFVALTNPYASGFDGTMQVQVLFEGNPRADAQVEVFARAPDGAVTVTLERTDAAGIAAIPVQQGHDYLFDAVVLRPDPEASTEDNAVVWRTYWAALTFSVPD